MSKKPIKDERKHILQEVVHQSKLSSSSKKVA